MPSSPQPLFQPESCLTFECVINQPRGLLTRAAFSIPLTSLSGASSTNRKQISHSWWREVMKIRFILVRQQPLLEKCNSRLASQVSFLQNSQAVERCMSNRQYKTIEDKLAKVNYCFISLESCFCKIKSDAPTDISTKSVPRSTDCRKAEDAKQALLFLMPASFTLSLQAEPVSHSFALLSFPPQSGVQRLHCKY